MGLPLIVSSFFTAVGDGNKRLLMWRLHSKGQVQVSGKRKMALCPGTSQTSLNGSV